MERKYPVDFLQSVSVKKEQEVKIVKGDKDNNEIQKNREQFFTCLQFLTASEEVRWTKSGFWLENSAIKQRNWEPSCNSPRLSEWKKQFEKEYIWRESVRECSSCSTWNETTAQIVDDYPKLVQKDYKDVSIVVNVLNWKMLQKWRFETVNTM